MAASISTAATATTTTTTDAPSTAFDTQRSWDIPTSDNVNAAENSLRDKAPAADERPIKPVNGNSTVTNPYDYGFEPLPPSRKRPSVENMSSSLKGARSWDRSNRLSDASTRPGYHDDGQGTKRGVAGERRVNSDAVVEEWDDENSKWIHRDKLAKIESQELQAAGIFLPRARAGSKQRKGRSQERPGSLKRTQSTAADKTEEEEAAENGALGTTTAASTTTAAVTPTHRKNSSAAEHSMSDTNHQALAWDLRLPEEIEAEGDGYWMSTPVSNGGSKIPVAKLSPAPIPDSYLDRPSPSPRRQSDGPDADSIAYPKTRSRSGSANALTGSQDGMLQPAKRSLTETSPKKGAGTGTRKTSAPAKTNGPPTSRPKTRGGTNKDSTSSNGTRPSTRSGELSPGIRQPEGDPPWMIGAYKPDPRLPPDQQLLPTVARRLQQEKWEKEGKFGSVYDKEFRPLTDEGLLRPPEPSASATGAQDEQEKHADEWPLRAEQRSPTLKQGTSYSTIPKISEKHPHGSPLPSPRTPTGQQPQDQAGGQQRITRLPDSADEQGQKKGGCGCCVIM